MHISRTDLTSAFLDNSSSFFSYVCKILVDESVPELWFKLIRPAEEVPSQRHRAREETGGQPMESDKLRPPADNSILQKRWQTLPLPIRSNHNRKSQRGGETAKGCRRSEGGGREEQKQDAHQHKTMSLRILSLIISASLCLAICSISELRSSLRALSTLFVTSQLSVTHRPAAQSAERYSSLCYAGDASLW